MIGCADCIDLTAEVERLKAENERLITAVQRESEQWDRRAPHTAKAPHERYGYGPHLTSN